MEYIYKRKVLTTDILCNTCWHCRSPVAFGHLVYEGHSCSVFRLIVGIMQRLDLRPYARVLATTEKSRWIDRWIHYVFLIALHCNTTIIDSKLLIYRFYNNYYFVGKDSLPCISSIPNLRKTSLFHYKFLFELLTIWEFLVSLVQNTGDLHLFIIEQRKMTPLKMINITYRLHPTSADLFKTQIYILFLWLSIHLYIVTYFSTFF